MKKILLAVCLLIGSQWLAGCFININDFDCVSGSRRTVSEFRQVRTFEGINVAGDFEVHLLQGRQTEVEVVAEDNLMNKIETYVSGGILYISTRGCVSPHTPMRVYVQTPNISSVELSGSGSIISENQLVSRNLSLVSSGSGSFDCWVDVENLRTNLSGSGKIYLEGLAQNQNVSITGSGFYDAFKLDTQTCSVNISGSGRVNVWVYSVLDVTISGSGQLRYRGRPRIRTNMSGSGQLIDAN